MAWQNKLEITRAALAGRPEMAIVFDEPKLGAGEAFLQRLVERHPFLPDDYLLFLRQCDGLQIDMCVLYGSGATSFRSIAQASASWHDVIDVNNYCPIGEDSGGSCFALSRDGAVWRFDQDPPDAHAARKMAATFSEFVDSVLMGARFPDLFDGKWQNRNDNEWSQHLKEQGWM